MAPAFDRLSVWDGDELDGGSLRIRVVATPDRTPTHASYIVDTGVDPAVLSTGGPGQGPQGRASAHRPEEGCGRRSRASAAPGR